MEEQFLSQLVSDPTRGNNTLDVVMSNNTETISHVEVLVLGPRLSDHSLIVAHLVMTGETPRECDPIGSSIHSSSIPSYETLRSTPEQWLKY